VKMFHLKYSMPPMGCLPFICNIIRTGKKKKREKGEGRERRKNWGKTPSCK